MDSDEIAHKYVHGHHDALTDNQEKIDMAKDIRDFAKQVLIDYEMNTQWEESGKPDTDIAKHNVEFYLRTLK